MPFKSDKNSELWAVPNTNTFLQTNYTPNKPISQTFLLKRLGLLSPDVGIKCTLIEALDHVRPSSQAFPTLQMNSLDFG